MDKPVFLYVTCASPDEACKIARAAVEKRLAACGNIFPAMHSIYRWQGAVQESAEAVLILKTVAARRPALEALVAELHSYEVPCIATLDVAHMNEAYRAWLAASVEDDVVL